MNRNGRKKEAYTPSVENVQLNEQHLPLRLIAIAVLLAVSVLAFANGLNGLLTAGTGWQQVEADPALGATCAEEFVLNYEIGRSSEEPTLERKQLRALYTEMMQAAYKQFHTEVEFVDVGNLYSINHSPNQPVQVGGLLYAALEQLQRSGSRAVYLGPVYAEYWSLFCSESAEQAAALDPLSSPEQAAYFAQVCAFAADPQAAMLELQDNNTVVLHLSAEYLAFAEEYGVQNYLDFFWMKNAFIADAVADALAQKGYTHGYLASYDGFTRNLDADGRQYVVNLFGRPAGQAPVLAAKAQYAGPQSIVSLRAFPVSEGDQYYFAMPDGTVRTPYLDPADGICKAAVPNLMGFSAQAGCAELLLGLLPLYAADALPEDASARLEQLAQQGIATLYTQGERIVVTDRVGNAPALSEVYQSEALSFAVEEG